MQQLTSNVCIDPSRIYIRRAARTRSTPLNQARPNPSATAAINLDGPERASGRPPPAGFVLVANFHTHPVRSNIHLMTQACD